jgi:myo-inositol-1(or 4)-monophosphatase
VCPTAVDLEELAGEVARAAGDLVRAGFGTSPMQGTKSSPTDWFTEVDVATEMFIAEHLTAALPDSSVFGEELGVQGPATGATRWIVDPIDGTINFSYGVPAVAVSIAAAIDGTVVAGAIFDPLRDETFSAHRRGGARLNGVPIAAGAPRSLDQALIGTGFSYVSGRRRQQAEVLVKVAPAVRDIRRLGACALDLAWVAAGRLDGFYEAWLQPWDFAAGLLIATEAGCVSRHWTPFDSWSIVVVAPPSIFDDLHDLVWDDHWLAVE